MSVSFKSTPFRVVTGCSRARGKGRGEGEEAEKQREERQERREGWQGEEKRQKGEKQRKEGERGAGGKHRPPNKSTDGRAHRVYVASLRQDRSKASRRRSRWGFDPKPAGTHDGFRTQDRNHNTSAWQCAALLYLQTADFALHRHAPSKSISQTLFV